MQYYMYYSMIVLVQAFSGLASVEQGCLHLNLTTCTSTRQPAPGAKRSATTIGFHKIPCFVCFIRATSLLYYHSTTSLAPRSSLAPDCPRPKNHFIELIVHAIEKSYILYSRVARADQTRSLLCIVHVAEFQVSLLLQLANEQYELTSVPRHAEIYFILDNKQPDR